MFRVPGCPCLGQRPAPLAGGAPSATEAVGNAGEVKAPRSDGHSLRAEDAATTQQDMSQGWRYTWGKGQRGSRTWECMRSSL